MPGKFFLLLIFSSLYSMHAFSSDTTFIIFDKSDYRQTTHNFIEYCHTEGNKVPCYSFNLFRLEYEKDTLSKRIVYLLGFMNISVIDSILYKKAMDKGVEQERKLSSQELKIDVNKDDSNANRLEYDVEIHHEYPIPTDRLLVLKTRLQLPEINLVRLSDISTVRDLLNTEKTLKKRCLYLIDISESIDDHYYAFGVKLIAENPVK